MAISGDFRPFGSSRVAPDRPPHGLHPPRDRPGPEHREGGDDGVCFRGRRACPESTGEAREVAPQQWEGSHQPRAPHPGKGRRQAPEVTREWPADRATPRPPTFPWPLVLVAGLLALVILGLVPGPLLTTPAGLAILASLTALSALAFRMSLTTEDPADRALRRAQRAIWLDEDPRLVIMRLRGVGLRGRPRLRRDIAIRCLERAGRCDRLDRMLRRPRRPRGVRTRHRGGVIPGRPREVGRVPHAERAMGMERYPHTCLTNPLLLDHL
jgi:hypothetical protein